MLSLAEIRQATRGRLVQGDSSESVSSVSIDTRTIKPGALYVAIKGVRLDGHQFVKQALANGARAVLVSRPVKAPGAGIIRVADTTRALGLIAAHHRRKFSGKVIAITGSAGKTSTKNVLAAVMAQKYKVLKSERSENNWIGVPLTLLRLRREHEVAIVEAGTNQRGDIAWLARIIQPDMVILTNTGETHLTGLTNRQGVYREKINLAKTLGPKGIAIYNADDPYLALIQREGLSCRLKSFSLALPSKCRGRNAGMATDGKMNFSVNGRLYQLPNPGRHHIYNALAAVSCAREFKLPYPAVRDALAEAKPDPNRGLITKVHRLWLMDDSYNANPVSFERALETIAEFSAARRRIVVCGDMLELGSSEQRLHSALGALMSTHGVDVLLTIGVAAQTVQYSFAERSPERMSWHCANYAVLHRRLKRLAQPGDLILVKGSRSMHMEKTVTFVKNQFN